MSIGQIVSGCPIRTGIAKTKESNSWRWSKARILFIEDLPFIAEEDESQDMPILQPIAKVKGGFADVAGFDELKHRLSDEVIWPLKNKAKAAKYGITPPNGMLLYGPPGCGKTFFAEK